MRHAYTHDLKRRDPARSAVRRFLVLARSPSGDELTQWVASRKIRVESQNLLPITGQDVTNVDLVDYHRTGRR